MPRINGSSNLNDYSRSRRYELLRRIRNPHTSLEDSNRRSRRSTSQNYNNSNELSTLSESNDFILNSEERVNIEEGNDELVDRTIEDENDNGELEERSDFSREEDGDDEELEERSNFSREGNDDDEELEERSDFSREGNDDDEELEERPDFSREENESDEELEERSDLLTAESDDNGDHEDDNEAVESDEEENDAPVYDGAPISLAESMLSTFVFSLTHNLTGLGLANLLKLISLHMPSSSLYKKTVYKFMNYFKDIEIPLKKHFYCSVCYEKLETGNSNCECGNTEKSYFIEIPIMAQLQQLLLKPGFVNDLSYPSNRTRYDNNSIEDIYDGRVYKDHVVKNNPSSDIFNLSFMWHTDGAPVFKSRKYNVWPFYLVINELPYCKRIKKENIIVAGIWFGPSDPVVNLYLSPIYDQLLTFHDGVNLKIPGRRTLQTVKAHLIGGTCDSPARADFLNHTRFNGKYGCPRCLIPGYSIREDGVHGNTFIYPFEAGLPERRSHQQHRQHALQAIQQNSPKYGVKGPSILANILPDIIRGISIDVMHCVYLGVVRKMLELWLDRSYRYERFSLYSYREIINNRFLKIKPPQFIKRMPRSLTENFKFLKASELKAWFFFYSVPILKDLLKQEYFNHYLQLVHGVFILNQNSITLSQLEESKYLLTCFISKFQYLYDPRFMSFNIHALEHLPEVVEDLGPLWVTSCFPFEDLIGKMVNYVHGTRYVGIQIYTKVVHSMIITNMLEKLENDSDSKKLCVEFLTIGRRISVSKKISENTFALGKISYYNDTLPHELLDPLSNIGIRRQDAVNIFSFQKLKKGNQTIYTRSCRRQTNFCSYCIVIDTPNGSEIGFAELFIKICYCENIDTDICNINCNNRATYYVLFQKATVETVFQAPKSMSVEYEKLDECRWLTIPYLYRLKTVSDPIKLVDIKSIISLCYVMNIRNEVYVGKSFNDIEFDQ